MAISVKNITVTFPGVVALDRVSLDFLPGRVHAVLGANGSGKSTLVKVLTGVYQPDPSAGAQITIDEKTIERFDNPTVSKEAGVSVVHQEAPLINVLSVAENVALFKGYPKRPHGAIDWRALYSQTESLLRFYGLDIDARRMVHSLSASERGMVAMAIALGKDDDLKRTKALILDEADASIPEAEAERFLRHVKGIAKLGIPVIMVTHRLKEVKTICDDVTILNDGRQVFSGPIGSISEQEIISKMLRQDQPAPGDAGQPSGESTLQELWALCGRTAPPAYDGPVLRVDRLTAANLNGLSFQMERGEVVGFVGIPDSGVNELPMVLGGDIPRESGDILLAGKPLPKRMTPRKAIQSGIMLQPTDRFRQGGVMSASLRDNMLLPNERRFWHKRRRVKETMEKAVSAFDVRPQIAAMPFGKFSGGNQQKAIIGKWLQLCPTLFVMDDPTYGVDPAARQKIFSSIREASGQGVSIIVFSTEPEQLAYICTRVLVLRAGQIVQELSQKDGTLTRESIARWCYA
ncbi:MAG: sugar ABC transporter ATP-binding protein [Eubacteriales bacterium]|nr:sugar ABC transporter ATP-binding protein [Eubacteriales bacterium]